MPHPSRFPVASTALLACLFAGLSSFAGAAHALGPADPFATDALTPPPPALRLDAEGNAVPCPAPARDAVYGVVEVVDLALCSNPTTHEAWANARAQAAQVGIADSAWLPGLDGRAGGGRQTGDSRAATTASASLTLSWLLYDSGARAATLEKARQLLAAASSTLDASVQNVFLAALQAYYNTQAARAAVAAARESEKASQESLSAAQVRYQVGTGTPADRLQAQTAASQATLGRLRAEGVLKIAYGTLAGVMGLDADTPLALDAPPAPADAALASPASAEESRRIDALIEEARRRRPDLAAAQARVGAAQAAVDLARANGRPTLSLDGGPSWLRSDAGGSGVTTQGNALGVTLSVPIFSGFSTTYQVRSAQAGVQSASAQRDALRLQVAQDVWSAYQSLGTATHTVRTSADLLASAEQSERVALGRYKAGVGTILDLLNAQSALASARLQRIQALLDWYVSRATLAKAVGALDRSLLDAPSGNR